MLRGFDGGIRDLKTDSSSTLESVYPNFIMSLNTILITGGTGYVGGRLIPLLCDRDDIKLRLMARKPDYLRARVGEAFEIIQGDVTDPESLVKALEGIETAFYLIHSMGSGSDFEDEDRQAARNFALAAREANVKRIVYLGGLGDERERLSKHLRLSLIHI